MPRLDKHYPKQLFEGLKRRRARPRNLPPRPIIEDLPVIDIRKLAPYPENWFKKFAFPNITFHITALRSLTLSRAKCEIVLTSGKAQTLALHWRTVTGARCFRGRHVQPAFMCRCGRKARKVFLHGGEFTCKKCTGGVYACQTADRYSRPILQRDRLATFVRGYPAESENLPPKPLWWQRKSYSKVADKFGALSARIARGPRRNRTTKRRTAKMIKPLLKYDLRVAKD